MCYNTVNTEYTKVYIYRGCIKHAVSHYSPYMTYSSYILLRCVILQHDVQTTVKSRVEVRASTDVSQIASVAYLTPKVDVRPIPKFLDVHYSTKFAIVRPPVQLIGFPQSLGTAS